MGSGNLKYTSFRMIERTSDPVNLLCQVVGIRKSIILSESDVLLLLVRDIEGCDISPDFLDPFHQDTTKKPEFLVIRISNMNEFCKRNEYTMLQDVVGSDDFFSIVNLTVDGDGEPPFFLRLDGRTCTITRCNKHAAQFVGLR